MLRKEIPIFCAFPSLPGPADISRKAYQASQLADVKLTLI